MTIFASIAYPWLYDAGDYVIVGPGIYAHVIRIIRRDVRIPGNYIVQDSRWRLHWQCHELGMRPLGVGEIVELARP